MSKSDAQGLRPARREWVAEMAKYARSSPARAWWQLASTFLLYAFVWALAIHTVHSGLPYGLTLGLVVVAAGLLVRLFIFFHDACHGSFFRSPAANRALGRILGVLAFTPFDRWRASHLRHHATAGDLDRRGEGDTWLMTVREYLEAPRGKRIAYRLFRNPVVMFGVGPAIVFFGVQRLPDGTSTPRERRSVLFTNLGLLALLGAASATIGFWTFVKIQVPIMLVAGTIGLWLFYVQHDFTGVRWTRHEEWSPLDSALAGSSWYKLPKVLQWFSGNIGLHHVHHARPRIPNYHLQRCHDDIAALRAVRPLTLFGSLGCVRLNLWDEDAGRLVGFRSLRGRSASPPGEAPKSDRT